MNEILSIPEEYLGEYHKGCRYVNTTPRKWTEKEIEWTKMLIKKVIMG